MSKTVSTGGNSKHKNRWYNHYKSFITSTMYLLTQLWNYWLCRQLSSLWRKKINWRLVNLVHRYHWRKSHQKIYSTDITLIVSSSWNWLMILKNITFKIFCTKSYAALLAMYENLALYFGYSLTSPASRAAHLSTSLWEPRQRTTWYCTAGPWR